MFRKNLGANRKAVLLVLGTCISLAFAFWGTSFYFIWRSESDAWVRTVDLFNRCDLNEVLYQLGYRASVYSDSSRLHLPRESDPLFDALKKVAEDERLDLDAITLGHKTIEISTVPEPVGSVSLLDKCRSLVDQGELDVALDVGRFYLITQKASGLKWLESAAEKGMPAAHRLLGVAYRKGAIKGIKDESKAFAYFMKAANAGDTRAKLYVAEMSYGMNPVAANLFLSAAAEEGSVTAAYRLQNSAGIRSPEKQYFWSLVFAYLLEQDRRKEWWQTRSESATEYQWEGLPEISAPARFLFGSTRRGEVVEYYSEENAKQVSSRLEAVLPLPARMAVQELFKEWVSEKYRIPAEKPVPNREPATRF